MNTATFNYLEALLWLCISSVLLVVARLIGRNDKNYTVSMVAAVSFAAFGITDVIEASTGAWWKPWWLLLFKSVCVVVFIACFAFYKKNSKSIL